MMRSFGAVVKLMGEDLDEAKIISKTFASKQKIQFIDDGEDLETLAEQAPLD